MIKKLVKNLKTDKDYFYAWQSNIAIQFADEYYRKNKKYKNRKDIHDIANQAAINFLNLLTTDKQEVRMSTMDKKNSNMCHVSKDYLSGVKKTLENNSAEIAKLEQDKEELFTRLKSVMELFNFNNGDNCIIIERDSPIYNVTKATIDKHRYSDDA